MLVREGRRVEPPVVVALQAAVAVALVATMEDWAGQVARVAAMEGEVVAKALEAVEEEAATEEMAKGLATVAD